MKTQCTNWPNFRGFMYLFFNATMAVYFLSNCTFSFVLSQFFLSQFFNMTSLCVKLYLRRDFIGRWVQPSLPWASMAQGSSRLNRNTSKGKQFARHNVRYFSHRLNFQNSFFLNVKVLRFRCSNCLGEFSITLRNGGYVGVSNADVGELLHSLEGSIFDS